MDRHGRRQRLGTLLYAVAPARTARPRVVESLEQPSIGLGSYLNGLDGGGALAYARVKDLGEFRAGLRVRLPDQARDRHPSPGRRPPRTIVVLPELAQLLAAGGDRIVLRVGDELRILDAAGAVVASRPARGVLRARRCAATSPCCCERTGWSCSTAPGARPSRAARAPGARRSLFDANRGLVAYTAGREVRAVRLLADGADALVERVPAARVEGAGLAGVAVGSAGVVWAVHDRCSAPGACRATVRLLTQRRAGRAVSRRRTTRPSGEDALRRMVACSALLAAAAVAQPAAAARWCSRRRTSRSRRSPARRPPAPSSRAGGSSRPAARRRRSPGSGRDLLLDAPLRRRHARRDRAARGLARLRRRRHPPSRGSSPRAGLHPASQIAFASVPDGGAGKDLAGVVAEGGGLGRPHVRRAVHDHARSCAASRRAGRRSTSSR